MFKQASLSHQRPTEAVLQLLVRNVDQQQHLVSHFLYDDQGREK